MTMTYCDSFIGAIREAGLDCVPDIIEPGKLHRFPGLDKPQGNTAGWCRLYPDTLGGVFGDWSTGLYENWWAKPCKQADSSTRDQFRREAKRAANARKAEQRQQFQLAALRASAIWVQLPPANERFAYLQSKQVGPHGARLLAKVTIKIGDQVVYGPSMVIPLQNTAGHIRSLQFITALGRKLFLKGGEITGNFYPIGPFGDTGLICVCEGFSTGATIHQETGRSVAIAFNAGNLKAVAVSLRLKYPNATLIICGDNDRTTHGNPGATKAKEAATAARARLAVVQFPEDAPLTLTDYNDLMVWERRREAKT